MEGGQVTAYFTKDCRRKGSAEQRRGIRANEGRKHTAEPGAFSVSGPHNHGNNIAHMSRNTARVNIHIPSLAMMKHMSLCAENNRSCLS